MQKKILSIVLALVMVLSMFPVTVLTVGAADSTFDGGTGTPTDPYLISTAAQLNAVRNNLSASYKLTANINLGGNANNLWTPIGDDKTLFAGTFDGDNHKITGLYTDGITYVGLFGELGGTIKNLSVDGQVSGGKYVGGLVGWMQTGLIDNCYFTGSVTGKVVSIYMGDAMGGIVGYIHEGTVQNSHNSGSIISNEGIHLGGIAGRIYSGKIVNCDNTGAVTGQSTSGYAGGITGENASGTIMNCYNSGTVASGSGVGGVTGYNTSGTVTNCYNNGSVTGSSYVGGISGYGSGGTITECYNTNTAAVTGTNYVGGIVGQNCANALVKNCYNEATVTGTNYVGGIVGRNNSGTTKTATAGNVANCYSRGSVTATAKNANVGGVAGQNSSTTAIGTIANCYYLTGNATGGISGSDEAGQAEVKTEPQFNSGEVAWLLHHGNGGNVWVQNIIAKPYDPYPLLSTTYGNSDKPKVLKVTFVTNPEPEFKVAYTNSGGIVTAPTFDELKNIGFDEEKYVYLGWHIGDVNGPEYYTDGIVTATDDIIVVVAQREKFGGEGNTVTTTYGLGLTFNLDDLMAYASGVTSAADRFDYSVSGGLGSVNGNILTIPADTQANESGYVLTVTAKEKQPMITTFSVGKYDTKDVTVTLTVVINKATPEISVEAENITFGGVLDNSKLSGTAKYLDKEVAGSFAWDAAGAQPDKDTASSVGYSVTFTPEDRTNYNSVSTMVKFNMGNAQAEVVNEPTANNKEYDGIADALLTGGAAVGGTFKYSLEENGVHGDFSATVPSKANAGTYRVWYKVVGDTGYDDSEEAYVDVTISPKGLDLDSQSFTYNGSKELTVTLPGVLNENVTLTLTANSKDAKAYVYNNEDGEGKYTVALDSTNYEVATAGTLTINKLPVELKWSDELTFTYAANTEREVSVEVTNKLAEDTLTFDLTGNTATNVGDYEAKVENLSNPNYTLEGVQNATQAWHIVKADSTITLEVSSDDITYGDDITLTATVTGAENGETVTFTVNGNKVVETINGGVATLTLKATSANNLNAGVNAVSAVYGGDANVEGSETDAKTVNIAKKTVTAVIVGDNTTKTYDGTPDATDLKLSLSGVEAGDTVTATAATFTYNDANAGDGKTITANNITLDGEHSNNYELKSNTAETTGEILQREVGLEWRGVTGNVYNGNTVNVYAVANRLVPNEEVYVEVEGGNRINANTDAEPYYTATAVRLLNADGSENKNYKLPADVEKQYKIEKAKLYVPSKNFTYDGNSIFTIVLNGVTLPNNTVEEVTVILTATDANAGAYSYGNGENTYTAKINGELNDRNYEIVDGGILTIEKAEIAENSYTAPEANVTVYNGEAQSLLLKAGTAEYGTMMYSLDINGVYATTFPTGTDAGSYTVYYKVVGDANHNDTDPRFVTAEIAKADPLVTAPEAILGLVYSGAEQELATAGTVLCGELQYSLDGDEYSANIPTGIGAGEYTVYYKVVCDENDNYDSVEKRSFKVAIDKAYPDYEAPVLTVDYGKTFGDVKFDDEHFAWNEDIDLTASVGDVGVYMLTATYTPDDTENYLTVDVTVTLTVLKVDPQVTAPEAKELTYTGEAQALVTAGTADGGELWYKLGEDGEYSKELPTAADAGTYTVYYKVVGDKNHNDIEATVDVTIEKADAQVTAPTANELTYTGDAQVLVTAGTADGGELWYKLGEDGEYSKELPTATDAGTYTVYYKVVGDKNHNGIDIETAVNVTIKKADPKFTAPEAKELTYNTLPQDLLTAGTTNDGEVQYSFDGIAYSKAIPTQIDAGTYTVYYKVVGDKNHNDIEPVAITVTIKKATPIFTIPELTAYTGQTLKDVEFADKHLSWNNPSMSVGGVGVHEFAATYTPDDLDNYHTVVVPVKVTVKENPNPPVDPDPENPNPDDPGNKPGTDDPTEGSDDFRCKMCDIYEANKDRPVIGLFYRFIHYFVHLAHRIGFAS